MIKRNKYINSFMLTIVMFFVLIPVLAYLQYVWLGQLSEAEKVRMQENLNFSTRRFSEDFDNEMTKIQSDISLIDNLKNLKIKADFINKALLKWKNQTQFPQLIKDIYYVTCRINGKISLYKLDTLHINFSKSDWPETFNNIKDKFFRRKDGILISILPLTHVPILGESSFIVTSVYEEVLREIEIKKISENCEILNEFIIIHLDNVIIKQKLIKKLIEIYLKTSDELRYNIALHNGQNPEEVFFKSDENLTSADMNSPDAQTDIGRWRKSKFIFARSEVKLDLDKDGLLKTETNMTNRNITIQMFKRDTSKDSDLTQYLITDNPGWKLSVKYKDTTLESIVSGARFNNLMISYLILGILGITVFMALISARRMRNLAQQQMDFVANISHELRTPLSVIQSAGENIADGLIKDDKKIREYGKLIKEEGKRLTNRVEQTLEFAGIQSGKKIYDKTPINLNEIMNAEIEKINIYDHHKIDIITDMESDLPVIQGDSESLGIAIENILNNSVKFSKDRDKIQIGIETKVFERQILISITDNGMGILHEDIAYIFEPFYRSKNVLESQIKGSGLGLSIVKEIIKAHGGRIIIESKIGQGSTFTIFLPVNN